MARITHVKRAQQRYATRPVLDDAGKPVRVPVTSKRTGEQKTTRRGGRAVLMTRTVADKTRPLPMPRCDYHGCKHASREIRPGEPYKHISPKSGPYGGRTLSRHEDCPSWQVWEYSSSLSARLAEIAYVFSLSVNGWESREDAEAARDDAAQAVRDLAEEKRESAQNIEDGFGHPTSTSEELGQVADDLDSWADEIEGADVPDWPDPGDADCGECAGTGSQDGARCEECEGSGHPEDPTDDQIEEWRQEAEDVLSLISEPPA